MRRHDVMTVERPRLPLKSFMLLGAALVALATGPSHAQDDDLSVEAINRYLERNGLPRTTESLNRAVLALQDDDGFEDDDDRGDDGFDDDDDRDDDNGFDDDRDDGRDGGDDDGRDDDDDDGRDDDDDDDGGGDDDDDD
jgi:hypothetical protein